MTARPAASSSLLRAALLLLALIVAAPATAQTFPAFTGFVVDGANVLSPQQEAALTTKLDGLQRSTGRQLVVATVPSLQGYTIEDYGYRLGRVWGVGLKTLDNGAILLVAPTERKVRVEVGYGLTPVLTDLYSTLLIRNRILPAFKAGDLPGGIAAGVDDLVAQLSLPDAEAKAKVEAAAAEHARAESGGGVPLGLVFWGLVAGFVLLALLRGRGGGGGGSGGRRFRSGGFAPPVILWGPGFGGGGGGSFGGGGASGDW